MKKIVALLAALILTLSMMSIASAEPIKSTYNLSEVSFIDQVGLPRKPVRVSGMSRSSWSSILTRALSFWMKTMWIAFGAA